VDHEIGRVLDHLDSWGPFSSHHQLNGPALNESTIVCFHSDHGFHLGESNIWAKYNNFELSARVPLIVRAPSMPLSAGHTSTLMAELVDVYPTLIDLASPHSFDQLTKWHWGQDTLDGVSLAPAFENASLTSIPVSGPTANKTRAFTQYNRVNPATSFAGGVCPWTVHNNCSDTPETFTSVNSATCSLCNLSERHPRIGYSMRTEKHRFTAWIRDEDRAHFFVPRSKWTDDYVELYDVSNDFDEMDRTNKAYDKQWRADVEELSTQLKMAMGVAGVSSHVVRKDRESTVH